MLKEKIGELLNAAHKITNHTDYVIIGSLSILGAHESPPENMITSIDVDLYPRDDPGSAGEIQSALGQGSEFEAEHGIYADAVSPDLPALPDGWRERLVPIKFGKATGWFLEPNDAAVSKYIRGEARDREWIRAGLKNGILSMPTIEILLPLTYTASTEEAAMARARMMEDKTLLGLDLT
jgi:hypothetical protein